MGLGPDMDLDMDLDMDPETDALLSVPAQQSLWALPAHRALLGGQDSLGEADAARVVVTDLASWEQVREHDLAVCALETAAASETAHVARALARRRVERAKAQAQAQAQARA